MLQTDIITLYANCLVYKMECLAPKEAGNRAMELLSVCESHLPLPNITHAFEGKR